MLSLIRQLIDQQGLRYLLGIHHRLSLIGSVKPGGSDSGITNPVDSHKTAVSAGSSNPTDPTAATCSRSTTRS
ncbi:hypothetical protein VAWG005_15850 [Aeromonas dhakensis]|nr:hypothetical protein VAWG003_15810 [Aeromonas dhakensis]BEE25657.1 hypothetical protein VAWG005_15850 [Aeromonas dhakensis]